MCSKMKIMRFIKKFYPKKVILKKVLKHKGRKSVYIEPAFFYAVNELNPILVREFWQLLQYYEKYMKNL